MRLWSQKIELGGFHTRNRIVFPPLSANWATDDGRVSDRVFHFYLTVARGGCGLVVVSGTAISPEGKGTDHSLCLYTDTHVPGMADLAAAIKEQGSLAAIQLMHVGGQGNPAFTGYVPISPSGRPCLATGQTPRAMSTEEVHTIGQRFATAAHLAWQSGFQFVELHLAHGYLLHEFLSPYTNHRTDLYGGTPANRLRLILDIITTIKKNCPGLGLGVRISARDYLPDGLNPDLNAFYLPRLEEAGCEYFSVTAGIYETAAFKHQAMQHGDFFSYAREIKNVVRSPVIGVGKVLHPDMAEAHLASGACDLVAIGRALVADPFMLLKTENDHEFNPCLECGQCQYLRWGKKELQCPQWEKSCG